MRVNPSIHLDGTGAEAVKLYEKAFRIAPRCLLLYRDALPEDHIPSRDQLDRVYHAEFAFGDTILMLSDMDDPQRARNLPGNTTSVTVTFDAPQAAREAFDALSPGARIIAPPKATTYCTYFAVLADRFGVRWDLMGPCPTD